MKKFVKLSSKGKKNSKVIINAACDGKITTYVKHNPTGALIPITTDAVLRIKNGETLDIEEAEKLNDRFYFQLPFLAIRWGMDKKECLGKLIELGVPCFFNPNQVPTDGNKAMVCQDDVCIFQEYVDALEDKVMNKIKDVQPEYIKS